MAIRSELFNIPEGQLQNLDLDTARLLHRAAVLDTAMLQTEHNERVFDDRARNGGPLTGRRSAQAGALSTEGDATTRGRTDTDRAALSTENNAALQRVRNGNADGGSQTVEGQERVGISSSSARTRPRSAEDAVGVLTSIRDQLIALGVRLDVVERDIERHL